MFKPDILKIPLYCILLFAPLVLFYGFRTSFKSPVEIVLRDERLPVIPKEFYIADVVDERENRDVVGWLLPVASPGNKPDGLYPVDLRGGAHNAIKQFVSHNLTHNTLLRPVIIKLKKVNVAEITAASGRVEGKVRVVMSFNLQQSENDTLSLVTYDGKAAYMRSVGAAQDVEPLLRHVIENGLLYLNTWMDKQAGRNVKLAKNVKVSFAEYRDSSRIEGDTVYYSTNRPLNWNDFQSNVYESKYDAEVFPAMGYDEHTDISNATILLRLAMKVSMPKSACWVRNGSRNDYTLNHEQRHFDIAEIIAERFKMKILQEVLPVNNYDGSINVDYLEALRDMNKLQRRYDSETSHGSNQSAQRDWDTKIDGELKTLGVKK